MAKTPGGFAFFALLIASAVFWYAVFCVPFAGVLVAIGLVRLFVVSLVEQLLEGVWPFIVLDLGIGVGCFVSCRDEFAGLVGVGVASMSVVIMVERSNVNST